METSLQCAWCCVGEAEAEKEFVDVGAEPVMKPARLDQRSKQPQDGGAKDPHEGTRPQANNSDPFEGVSLDDFSLEDFPAPERDEDDLLLRMAGLPAGPEFSSWSVEDVAAWILSSEIDGKEDIASRIRAEEIDGATMLGFSNQFQVKQALGIALGEAFKVWAALEGLLKGELAVNQRRESEDWRAPRQGAGALEEAQVYWKNFWGQRYQEVASLGEPDDDEGNCTMRSGDGRRGKIAVKRFEVEIQRAEEGDLAEIGLNINRGMGRTLKITKIKAGCIEDWNQKNPGQRVELGDLVISVNGSSGSAEAIVNEIRNSRHMKIVIQRIVIERN